MNIKYVYLAVCPFGLFIVLKYFFFLLTKSNSRVFTFSQFIYENIFFFRSDNPYEPFHHFELSNGVANANVSTSAIEKLFFSIDSL